MGAILLVAATAWLWWFLADRAGADDSTSGPATAGVLPAETEMGLIELSVRDLDVMTAYYRDAIGLTVLEQSEDAVELGRDTPLIRLEAAAEAPDDPRSAGLYHSAILFADAPSLAQTLLSIAQVAPESYQGSADHAVSLAFYVGDPEGNGVELYLDRPRDEWVWQDGQVTMGSAPLDPNAFISEYAGGDASGAATMGHVHLRVGDLADARTFYSDVLGFDVTAEADGALFYSAGGYHHHVATNTWQSAGAGLRPDTAGLNAITIAVPAASDLDAVAARLADAGIAHESADQAVATADPWGNVIRFVAP